METLRGECSRARVCKMHRTVLYCTVLYCTVLYCTVLYCTVLLTEQAAPHRGEAPDLDAGEEADRSAETRAQQRATSGVQLPA